MDDLESRLEHQLSGLGRVPLAEPVAGRTTSAAAPAASASAARSRASVAIDDRGRGGRRASWSWPAADRRRPIRRSCRSPRPTSCSATSTRSCSRRASTPTARATRCPRRSPRRVAQVPGVQSVSGVRRHVRAVAHRTDGNSITGSDATRRTAAHADPLLVPRGRRRCTSSTGRAPAAADEIVVDADVLVAQLTSSSATTVLARRARRAASPFTIVGTSTSPASTSRASRSPRCRRRTSRRELQLDRLDVKLAAGRRSGQGARRDRGRGRQRLHGRAAVGDQLPRPAARAARDPARVLGAPEPRPDGARRRRASARRATRRRPTTRSTRDLATHVELRVENVSFLSPDAAALTYRIYYGGGPSPIITSRRPAPRRASNGHWQLGKNTLCSLAALVGIKCEASTNVTITPPNGYAAA